MTRIFALKKVEKVVWFSNGIIFPKNDFYLASTLIVNNSKSYQSIFKWFAVLNAYSDALSVNVIVFRIFFVFFPFLTEINFKTQISLFENFSIFLIFSHDMHLGSLKIVSKFQISIFDRNRFRAIF